MQTQNRRNELLTGIREIPVAIGDARAPSYSLVSAVPKPSPSAEFAPSASVPVIHAITQQGQQAADISAPPQGATNTGQIKPETTLRQVSSAEVDQTKRAFPAPAETLTQEGPHGIRFDGNEGCRVSLPEGNWHVRLSDLDTGNILFETVIGAGFVRTRKRYFCRFRIEVWERSPTTKIEVQILRHDYDASGRNVLIQFPIGTLGDTMGWFPYAEKFLRKHGCKLTCAMAERIIPLFKDAYPEMTFITHEQVEPENYYATYNIGLYFNDDHIGEHQPCDFRLVGLHRTAGHILGVDPTEERPRIVSMDGPRPIAEPYVVVATQSTTQAKYWNNPSGWREIIQYLKRCGYRVVCIDQKPVHGGDLVWNHLPHGVEDQTGDRPLSERAHWLRHAEFFVGLSSGLSWLAWATGVPVVLISGFTHPINEFSTPYRVINYNVCNSCWNDMRIQFDHKDFLWCPRQKGTPRQFECTRLITAEHVKTVLKQIPGFKADETVENNRKRVGNAT